MIRYLCVTGLHSHRRLLTGLRLSLAVLLLYCLCRAYRMWYIPQPPPGGVVFWEDDALAAREPYTYQFSSSSLDSFPGVAVSEVSVKCLPRGAATVLPGGGLGNLIMEFVTLWTAARIHNLRPFVSSQLNDRLYEVFKPLGVPDTSEFLSQSGCPEDAMEAVQTLVKVDLNITSLAEAVSQAKQRHQLILFERWVILPETIAPLADELRRHFHYRQSLLEYVSEKLWWLRKRALMTDSSTKEVVFVGVHVRRTDYLIHLQRLYGWVKPADEHYYGHAALWLKSTVVPPDAQLVLVVVSDDPSWVVEVLLPHLHALGMRHSFLMGDGDLNEPERDLALLSACNHSVIDYGTYGIWSALMAGGRTAVYHLDHGDAMSPAMQFAQHLPGWVAIS